MSDQPLSALAASLMEQDVSPSPLARGASRADALRSRASPDTTRYVMNGDAANYAKHDAKHDAHYGQTACQGWSFWHFLFVMLVLVLIFYFLYFALRPYFVLEQNCCDDNSSEEHSNDNKQCSQGRLLGAAIISAVILLIVMWMFWAAYAYFA